MADASLLFIGPEKDSGLIVSSQRTVQKLSCPAAVFSRQAGEN